MHLKIKVEILEICAYLYYPESYQQMIAQPIFDRVFPLLKQLKLLIDSMFPVTLLCLIVLPGVPP